MATKNVSISIELDLDDGNFTARMNTAGQSVQTFSDRLETAKSHVSEAEGAFGSFGERLGEVAVAAAGFNAAMGALNFLEELPQKVAEANQQLQVMETMMRGLSTGSTSEEINKNARGMLQSVLDFAKAAPFSLEALSDTFIKMKTVGIDPTKGAMQALVDAVAQFGGSDEKLKSAALAIQEMGGRGVLSLTQLRRQLAQAIPTAVQDMALGMGVSINQLFDMVQKGTVESTTAIQKMFAVFEMQFAGQGLAHMQNFMGQMQVLKTQWMELAGVIGNAGFMQELQGQLQNIINLMSAGAFNQIGQSVGQMLGKIVASIAELADHLINLEPVLKTVGEVFIATFAAEKILMGIRGITTALSALPGIFSSAAGSARAYNVAADATLAGMAGMESMGLRVSTTFATNLANSAGLAARAITGLSRAFLAFIPYIGPAVAVILTLADTFDLFGQKARDAMAALKDGFITEQNIINAKKLTDALSSQLTELQRERDSLSSGLLGAMGGGTSKRAQELDAEIAAVKQKITDASKTIGGAEDQMGRDLGAKLASQTLDGWRQSVQLITNQANDELIKLRTKIGTDIQDPEKIKANQQAIQAIYKEEWTKIGDVTQQQIKQVNNTIAAGGDDAKKIWAGTLGELQQKLLFVQEQLQNSVLTDPNKLVPKNSGKLSPYDAALRSLATSLAEVQARATGAGTKLAEINAQISEGKFGNIGADQIAKLRALASAIDDGTISAKKFAETQLAIKTAESDITKKFDESKTALAETWAQYKAGDAAMDTTQLQKYNAGLQQTVQRLRDLGVSAENIKKFSDMAHDAFSNAESQNIVQQLDKMKQKTAEIMASSEADTNQKREATYNAEVARIDALVAKFNGSEQDKAQMVADSEAYKRALRAQTDKAEENSFDKLMDTWSNGYKDLGNEASKALNSINDDFAKMATGAKVTFGDMVKSMIQDLIKLELQEEEAQIWNGGGKAALGSLGSMLGSLLGGGSGAGLTGAANSAGGAVGGAVQVAHGGAIIGAESFMSRLVNPALFAHAGRFHTGGFPGLQSGEVPAILQQGEGVFTPAQMAALGQGGGQSNVTINLINQSGMQMQAQQQGQPRFDGTQMVQDIVLKGLSQPGTFRDNVKASLAGS